MPAGALVLNQGNPIPMKTTKKPAIIHSAAAVVAYHPDVCGEQVELLNQVQSHIGALTELLQDEDAQTDVSRELDVPHHYGCIYDLVDDLKKLHPDQVAKKPTKKKR